MGILVPTLKRIKSVFPYPRSSVGFMGLVFDHWAAKRSTWVSQGLQAPIKASWPNSLLYLREMCPHISHFPSKDPLPAQVIGFGNTSLLGCSHLLEMHTPDSDWRWTLPHGIYWSRAPIPFSQHGLYPPSMIFFFF